MTEIDFGGTKVVRRTVEKGTRVIKESLGKQNWQGKEFKNHQKKVMKQTRDMKLASGKGTKNIRLSQLSETNIPSLEGRALSLNKGTKIRRI